MRHSNALHARIRERGTYLTGPLARYALNYDGSRRSRAKPRARSGLGPACRNPFRSIVVRAVEMLVRVRRGAAADRGYEPPDAPAVEVDAARRRRLRRTEAPRGMCYHRYEIDDDGTILDAKIVPPTSQNQLAIEHDLRDVVARHADLDDDALRHRCEQAIRNHDPCISCATHFLTLDVDRS